MYPQVVQFETRRLQVARELQLIRERKPARERVSISEVSSVAFKSTRLRRLLNRAGSESAATQGRSHTQVPVRPLDVPSDDEHRLLI